MLGVPWQKLFPWSRASEVKYWLSITFHRCCLLDISRINVSFQISSISSFSDLQQWLELQFLLPHYRKGVIVWEKVQRRFTMLLTGLEDFSCGKRLALFSLEWKKLKAGPIQLCKRNKVTVHSKKHSRTRTKERCFKRGSEKNLFCTVSGW